MMEVIAVLGAAVAVFFLAVLIGKRFKKIKTIMYSGKSVDFTKRGKLPEDEDVG